MGDDPEHRANCRVDPDHPSLAGHFPGNPIVPGVVILDQVLQALQSWRGQRLNLTEVSLVKFLAPLRPGQPFTVILRAGAQTEQVQFECVYEPRQQVLAKGKLVTRVSA